MTDHQDSFNLLYAPWIPVLYRNGTVKREGILAVLTEAHRIREIAASNPMDRVAVLRFLLALLYWCRGNPRDKKPDRFPPEWFDKLRENEDKFNLFGEGHRFYQTRDSHRRRPATDLLQEIPTANNFAHFTHATDYNVGLCPTCCALGLLRLPLFATSGLGGLRAGINGTPPYYLFPTGRSLADTLSRAWTPVAALGEPSWVEPVYSVQDEVPCLVGLTALSRRVWLHPGSIPDRTCIRCGPVGAAVATSCEYEGAKDMSAAVWKDPHVIYASDSDRATVPPNPMVAKRFVTDRPWVPISARAVGAGLFDQQEHDASYHVFACATNKALAVDTSYRVIEGAIGEAGPAEVHSRLMMWDEQGHRLGRLLARGRTLGPTMIAHHRPHIENVVSQRTRDLLKPDPAAWDAAAEEYGPFMQAIASAVAPGVTAGATARRRRIASLRPRLKLPNGRTTEDKEEPDADTD